MDREAVIEFTRIIKFTMALGSLLWNQPGIQAAEEKSEVQAQREGHASDIVQYMKDIQGQVLIVARISSAPESWSDASKEARHADVQMHLYAHQFIVSQ